MTEGVFLYYLPGKKFGRGLENSVTQKDLADNPILAGPFFELIHSPRVFKERLIGVDVNDHGPDGGAGVIFGIQPQVATNQIPAYLPNVQTWKKFGEQWIGWQTDMLPGPESLRRSSQFPGYEIELGDGKVWNAPIIRPFHEEIQDWGCSLPMVIGIDEKAEHSARIVERYRRAWDVTARIADVLFNGQPSSQFAFFDDAVVCLGMNYRIGAAEATILELFDSGTIREVARSAVDDQLVDQFLEARQKGNPTSRPEPANTSDGSQD